MKVVLNKCYGGFGLSVQAIELYLKRSNLPFHVVQRQESWPNELYYHDAFPDIVHNSEKDTYLSIYNISRFDPILEDHQSW